ncbi:MAG: M81 family metallopeptidase, partial [Acidimicrobiia bacterium]
MGGRPGDLVPLDGPWRPRAGDHARAGPSCARRVVSRVAVAGLWHETNTYSTRPTSLADFEAFELLRGEDVLHRHAGTGTVIGGMLEADHFAPVPIFSAGAWPGGRVTRDALDAVFELLENELRAALPVDGVLLNLHGAMVADDADDVELETLRRVRELVGQVPVAAVLDLHGNPSPEMVELSDAVIAYDTYPHVDMLARGREAAGLLAEILRGRYLQTVVAKVPLLSCPLAQATDEPPMRDLEALARNLAEETAVARVSLLPGFPYSDVARAGFSVLVTAEKGSADTAGDLASMLARQVEACRDDFAVSRDGPAAAVTRAVASEKRPVVLVDIADNVGGGAPGDGTAILSELLAQKATGAVVSIADVEVARAAARAGTGSVLEAEVGGKTDNHHGPPVPIRA